MQFLYDGQDVVADLNPDGSVTDYLNGTGIDQKMRQNSTPSGLLYFIEDHRGSTIVMTGAAGGVVERGKVRFV